MTAPLPVAILAGGLATRLRPHTERIPKALLEIAGRPFLAHQLELLYQRGLRRAVICCGYLGEQLEEFIAREGSSGLDVQFSHDGNRLLGTAGAVRRACPLLGDAFFVLYGDSYLECDYTAVQRAFEGKRRDALMTVFRNDDAFDRSNVEYVDGEIKRYDKRNRTPAMRHIDYGLGVFRANVFAARPTEPEDLATVYQQLLTDGRLAALEVAARFYEIGSHEGLAELRTHLAGRGTQQ